MIKSPINYWRINLHERALCNVRIAEVELHLMTNVRKNFLHSLPSGSSLLRNFFIFVDLFHLSVLFFWNDLLFDVLFEIDFFFVPNLFHRRSVFGRTRFGSGFRFFRLGIRLSFSGAHFWSKNFFRKRFCFSIKNDFFCFGKICLRFAAVFVP